MQNRNIIFVHNLLTISKYMQPIGKQQYRIIYMDDSRGRTTNALTKKFKYSACHIVEKDALTCDKLRTKFPDANIHRDILGEYLTSNLFRDSDSVDVGLYADYYGTWYGNRLKKVFPVKDIDFYLSQMHTHTAISITVSLRGHGLKFDAYMKKVEREFKNICLSHGFIPETNHKVRKGRMFHIAALCWKKGSAAPPLGPLSL